MKWIFIVTIFLFSSCEQREFKYRIYNPSYLDTGRPAYFFTDTFYLSQDTLFWINSDSTRTVVSVKSGTDCEIKKIK
jgi:hypothetical protein